VFAVDWRPNLTVLASGYFLLAEDVTAKSMREPLKRSIQQVAAPGFQQNFIAGGRPRWEPLADVTLAKKKNSEILVESGRLKKKAGQLNLWTIDGMKGEARADQAEELGVGYGIVHQDGAGNIPARPWADLTAQEVDKIEDVFGRWVSERVALRVLRP